MDLLNLTEYFDLHHVDPQANVWLTWANRTGTTDFCLSLAQAGDPFRTCLIGYPHIDWDNFKEYGVNATTVNSTYWAWRNNNLEGGCLQSNDWPLHQGTMFQKSLIEQLNTSSPLPFQELELWGSFPSVDGNWLNITNRTNCTNNSPQILPINGSSAIYFQSSWDRWQYQHGETNLFIGYQNVSGKSDHWNTTRHVGEVDVIVMGGVKLPQGYFLICGDRAWPGIPHRPVRGPCYIVKLTLFAPHIRDVMTRPYNRSKRSLRQLNPNCNDKVKLSRLSTTVALSWFLPGGMAASNRNRIKRRQ
ncbi:PREDICTED: uncharacterized protein LOC106894835 [Calidris pugnax]|uniref:uncharacterized protein LOC106894835 n=1 Tax=Calidris pugnax TaxID=198806 RepID=UPI00071E235A|nr:PREDICTED: uncharacterized protein LOC106894835 [Calidris pugnax]XP_014809274.1 PREDICTED: uncharacterized protein LOC106894835 [Calidris pugnax]